MGCLLLISCTNPFAPAEMQGTGEQDPLGNPRTIDGFFTRFKNAYQLRDTTLYGPLIQGDFTFTYRDYEHNVDVSWGRDEEMTSTYNMFNQSEDIQLQWNNIISQIVNDSKTQAQVIRRFNLAIVLKNSDVLHTDGSANFVLVRPDSTSAWKLFHWRDESNL
jgi:hypothetical protein